MPLKPRRGLISDPQVGWDSSGLLSAQLGPHGWDRPGDQVEAHAGQGIECLCGPVIRCEQGSGQVSEEGHHPSRKATTLACGQRECVNSAQVGRLIFISVCTTWCVGSLSGQLPPKMVKALGIATFG